MTARTAAASGMVVRGCALIVALGLATLARETTPASAAYNPYYTILNLRTFHVSSFCSEEDCESHATDVNNWGQVTGWSRLGTWLPNSPFLRAFRTAPNAPIDVYSPLPLLDWCTQPHCFEGQHYQDSRISFGNAINDSGWIVGMDCNYGHPNNVCDTPDIAFLAIGAQLQKLQVEPVGAFEVSEAKAINNLGAIVGVGPHASWIGNSGTLLPSSIWPPEDINDLGVVVGQTKSGRAFRWLGGSNIQDIGTLNPSCTTCGSIAHAVSDPGFTVGASQIAAQLPAVYHAFAWPFFFEPSMMKDLGTLCTGMFELACRSEALDVNTHGDIVGTSDTVGSGSGDPHGFLYKDSTMTDVNTLLSPTDQAAWILVDATAINDFGQIAGTGLFQHHKPRAYLLTPPVPFVFAKLKDLSFLFTSDLASERDSLGAKLAAGEAAFERNDLEEARRQLQLYEDDVRTFMRDRRLNQIQATKLLAGVELIRRELEER